MYLVEIDIFQSYKDFYERTSGFPCRATLFYYASPACGDPVGLKGQVSDWRLPFMTEQL